jgi:hypothetical protein
MTTKIKTPAGLALMRTPIPNAKTRMGTVSAQATATSATMCPEQGGHQACRGQ